MHAKSLQSCPMLCDPMDYSPPGTSIHGILQARILDWVAIAFCGGLFWLRDQTWVTCIAGRFFVVWATKILQAKLQQYMNWELPDIQAGFGKSSRTRDQIANPMIHWIIEKAREFQKNIYFCFIDYAKAFDSVYHNKLWKTLQEMGIPEHLTCHMSNLCAEQEATVRTGHGTRGWFQIGKVVHPGCILTPCLFNLCAEYVMWNAGLDEARDY